MAERDYSNNPDDLERDYPGGQGTYPGGITYPNSQSQTQEAQAPQSHDPYADYNGGSPPDAPLQPGHGWEWNGSRWVQVQGRGLGYQAPQQNAPPQNQSAPQQQSVGGQQSGVPSSYRAPAPTYGPSTLSGSVPTLADAIRDAKQLPAAPQIQPYAQFQAPTPVGIDQRNQILQSILNRPQVLDQTVQDQLFEQQKEMANSLAQQSRASASQQGASRGLSGGGGFQAAATADIDNQLNRTLLGNRRDIAVKAAELNRQSELAALEMQNALAQGDFARAASAHQLQLQAQAMFDEMRFKEAEFNRSNVALAASTGMAGRQQQLAEQVASFQQYLQQRQFDEMMRQFNEQMGLNWSQFGWNQQFDLASLFP